MSSNVDDAIRLAEEQLERLQERKRALEASSEQLKANAKASQAKGNNVTVKKHIRQLVIDGKKIEALTGQIANLNTMIMALLKGKQNRVSSLLARPLGRTGVDNEAALQRELNALTRNAAATPSTNHASYLGNMRRGVENALGAGAGTEVAEVVPVAGSPAYYNYLYRTQPSMREPYVSRGAPPIATGFGMPLMGRDPSLGGKSRRFRRKRKASRKKTTRRIR